MWTGGVLVLYFYLSNILLFGLNFDPNQGSVFGQFSSILAANQGSIMQLGIGPIVTASIVLQTARRCRPCRTGHAEQPRDQILYQGLQKLLVLVMICLTGLPMVFAGNFLPAQSVTLFGAQIGRRRRPVAHLRPSVRRWRPYPVHGRGHLQVGRRLRYRLFIIAGVSQRLIGGLFTFRPSAARNRAFSPRGSGLSSATSPPVRSWLPTGSSSFFSNEGGMILPLITSRRCSSSSWSSTLSPSASRFRCRTRGSKARAVASP